MNGLLGIVLLQYMISATAGLVDQSRGPANVRKLEQVVAGKPVETGPEGFVELQLTGESYLRVRENSSVVFDSVALADIQIRLIRGNAMIDSDALEPSASIKISAGNLTTSIRKPGIYLFSPDRVKVFNGQLDLANGTMVRKGYEAIATSNAYDVRKIDAEEIQHPYAPDKVKIFIEPKEDSSHDVKFLNSVFTKLCSEHFQNLRDAEIVSERSRAAYLLVVSGGANFQITGFLRTPNSRHRKASSYFPIRKPVA